MTWFQWVLVSYFALNIVIGILMIGKSRTPITPGVALISAAISGALIFGVVNG